MRHSRPFAAALLFTCLVVAGCGARGTSVTSAPAAPTPSAGALSDSATTGASPVTPVDAAKTPACTSAQGWGTGARQRAPYSSAPLYHVRAGRHACYDRVVFDVNGPDAVGYAVRYVPLVRADGSGKPVPVAGGAALEVVVRAPILGTDSQGHQPGSRVPAVGEDLVAPSRVTARSSVRQVSFAGSFEGQTTVAVGVRDRLPFRVFVTTDRGYRHVVLDVSH